ncbi:DUF1749 domain-containing protein, partial [Patescibacteria group bacterium]|nr:DUF1749 domain-containing protein [Patescibacteria group bacterium]
MKANGFEFLDKIFTGNIRVTEIVTKDKLRLPGILFEPKKRTKKAMIFLHGNGDYTLLGGLEKTAVTAQELAFAGIAYFVFENRGAHQYHQIKIKGSKKRYLGGTAYEKIKDCVKDIDAAVAFLKKNGYKELYLIGFSTGANKICVYNYYKPRNQIAKYVIACGGDDLGIYYTWLGAKKWRKLFEAAKAKVRRGKGKELVPQSLLPAVYSYQGIYDILNPDGDYNIFPYNEFFKKLKLSNKPLFRHFKSIKKPSFVVYGSKDEYSYGKVPQIVSLLKQQCTA